MKKALITGITGMDGSHLADFLLQKGYKVYGLERRSSSKHHENIKHILDKVHIVSGDLSDQNSLTRAVKTSEPDEVYNLASQSFVGESWNTPDQTGNITGLGVLRVLETLRESGKEIKFYQASSSEMFGKMSSSAANEETTFYPRSPYAVAKVYGHYISKNYRESYGMFNCNGILFNHESERRGIEFVTRKITHNVAKIYHKLSDCVVLGNLDSKRDWGYAPDFVEAMWKMMQHDVPDDYVISTGVVKSIGDLLDCAFGFIGISNWEPYVKQDAKYMRPSEVDYLKGDSSKALKVLDWKPKVKFEELVHIMMKNDIELVGRGVLL